MGNASRTRDSSALIARLYESVLSDILSRFSPVFITSYSYISNPVLYGQISNWVTYSLALPPNKKNINHSEYPYFQNDADGPYRSTSSNSINVQRCLPIYEGDRSRMARNFVRDSCKLSDTSEPRSYLKRYNSEALSFRFLDSSTALGQYNPTICVQCQSSESLNNNHHVLQLSAPCEEYGDIQTTSIPDVYEPVIQEALLTEGMCATECFHLDQSSQTIDKGNDRTSHNLQSESSSLKHRTTPNTQRSPYQKIKVPVYGALTNHKAFLEPDVLDFFVPFILDSSLLSCLCVCPHWFVTIYHYLKQRMAPVVEAFKLTYLSSGLEFLTTTISIQPLFTANNPVVRLDLLIYCKVLPQCVNQCSQFGYSFSYCSTTTGQNLHNFDTSNHHEKGVLSQQLSRRSEIDAGYVYPNKLIHNDIGVSENNNGDSGSLSFDEPSDSHCVLVPPCSTFNDQKTNEYYAQFRFETVRKHSRRTIWICRDICRFHGDELMVANLSNVPTVNVDDILEIPVNISNAFGLVNLNSVTWNSLEFITSPSEREFGQMCDVLRKNQQWFNLDVFQPTTNERLQINDFFAPQWIHLKTEFAGIDITCSRSVYIASEIGEVPQSRRWLGIQSIVMPRKSPIVCPLTRLGLQHDRFSPHLVRQGDIIILYILQGGSIEL